MIKLSDIAKVVDMDVSVVSRALNPVPAQHGTVKEETRRLIQETARKLGYRPNRQASFLKKGRAATILCFLPDNADRLIADLIIGITEEACRENFPVNFFYGNNPREFKQFIKDAEIVGHSGIISYPPGKMPEEMRPELLRYRRQGGNILFLNVNSNYGRQGLDDIYRELPLLDIDEYYGAQLVGRHLVEQGCREFYYVRGMIYTERYRGFAAEVERSGYTVRQWTDNTLAELKHTEHKVGIFAAHDFLAYQLMAQLAAAGIELGKQFLLASFDDQIASIYCVPSLTTVHQPTRREGRAAVEKLVRIIYGGQEKSEMLKPHLVIRESTGGARPDPAHRNNEQIME